MSVKLKFLGRDRAQLCTADITHSWLAPLPMPHEIITLPNGTRVKVVGREMIYTTYGVQTDVTLVFDCEVLR
jgi:hypothetical protein